MGNSSEDGSLFILSHPLAQEMRRASLTSSLTPSKSWRFQIYHLKGVLLSRQALFIKVDPGGEVETSILGHLLHRFFEGRSASLFWCFSLEPVAELNKIHGSSNSDMGQMGFVQTKIA
jgi:hypothetical protein